MVAATSPFGYPLMACGQLADLAHVQQNPHHEQDVAELGAVQEVQVGGDDLGL